MYEYGRTRGRYRKVWLGEFLATAALLLVMVTMARWCLGADSPPARAVPSAEGRLLVDALVSGGSVAALIASPFGRISGAHMNPAVSVAFWLMGALSGRAAALYVTAQLTGSAAGVMAGRLLWGRAVAGLDVRWAALRAADGASASAVFAGEATATVAMLAAVTFVAARARWAHLLPVTAGGAVAVLILAFGALTGGSFNPARQFGPELFAGEPHRLWIYAVAPVVGAAAFGLLRGRLRGAPQLARTL
jgi:glycerol uptake facilitator-like aquaporin